MLHANKQGLCTSVELQLTLFHHCHTLPCSREVFGSVLAPLRVALSHALCRVAKLVARETRVQVEWGFPAGQGQTRAADGQRTGSLAPASSSKRNGTPPCLLVLFPAYLSLSKFSHINETQTIHLSDQALTQSHSTVCCGRTLDHRSHRTTRKRPRRKRKQRFATPEPHQNHRHINTRTRATSHVE